MRCALVFYLVTTIFVIVYSFPELCHIIDTRNFGKHALCTKHDVKYIFDFIPLVYQNISLITLSEQPLKRLSYNAFRNISSQSNISVISLAHCQISHIDAGALSNLYNLTDIGLQNNNIKQIDSKLFSDTKQIKEIYMEFNKIEVLPKGLFQNLTLLKIVSLYNNRIRQVENYSFKNTPSLQFIYLYNNQIETMNMLFKDKFDNLTRLSLHGNPWKCNCELGPLYELLINMGQLTAQGLVCEKPPTLQGRFWDNISRDKFVCLSEDAISTQYPVIMTSTEPITSIEHDDTIPVRVHDGTRYQQVDTSIQNWTEYTILGLVLMCFVPVIIGVVLLKRRSFERTNARNVDSGLPILVIPSSVVSGSSDLDSNKDNVDEKSISIHHY